MSVRRLVAAAAVLTSLAGCSTTTTSPLPDVPLSSLVLVPAADTLHVGDVHSFTVTATDTSGGNVSNPRVVWHSTNTTVFTVTTGGSVSARGEGLATLTASSGGQVDSALILVLPATRGWFAQGTNLSANMNGVFFLPDGNSGWAVGALGLIARTTNAGATWTPSNPVVTTLNSVWFTSATEGWVAGDAGRILHTTNGGGSWTIVAGVPVYNLLGITFATHDTGWAVGQGGTILRTFDRGVTWTRTSVTAVALRSVSFSGTRDGWAVGDNGTIVGTHDRGLTWFVVQPSVTANDLFGVSRRSEPVAFAVGLAGVAPRTVTTPDSTAWELRNAGATYDLHSVWFVDALRGWAAGRNASGGAVLVTLDGGVTWTPQAVSNAFPLNGVHFVDGLRGWAVGDNGRVVHTVTGGAP